jgi:hypothetical protein
MSLRLNVSRRQWAWLGFSLILLGGLAAVHAVRPQFSAVPLAALARLEAERTALARFDEATLQRLRATASFAERDRSAGGDEIPPGWSVAPLPADHGGPRVRLARDGTPPLAWTELVRLIEQIEQRTPVLSLVIQSAGTRRHRTIDHVEIILGETPEEVGPEPARKIGLGPSLRRSSASTGGLRRPVPAPDPAAAAVRPAPPRWAGQRF